MTAKTFKAMIADVLPAITEVFPWDLETMIKTAEVQGAALLLVDIREADEYAQGAIKGSLHVPRGLLESACDWGYSDTVPALVKARNQDVVLICRSGNRSAMAAFTLQMMGFTRVYSLKTGIRGWNDYELPLYDAAGGPVDIDEAEQWLSPPVEAEQLG